MINIDTETARTWVIIGWIVFTLAVVGGGAFGIYKLVRYIGGCFKWW